VPRMRSASDDSARVGRNGETERGSEALPDSTTLSGLCPRCGVYSSFAQAGDLPIAFEGFCTVEFDGTRNAVRAEQVCSLICRHCQQGVAVVEEKWVGGVPTRLGGTSGAVTWHGIHWWPLPASRLSADVPPPIAETFVEATTALQANCPRAAAVMARRSLEAIAVDKGECRGSLSERLKRLADSGVLLPDLADWANEVRLVGNAGAHFDPINAVGPTDVRQLLAFLRELMRYLYELPAELSRRRGR